jgi:FAD/FMN-containing dehydrogenase
MTTMTKSMTPRATSVLRRLGDQLEGRLVQPGDSGYEESRTVWNAMVDRRPRAIARCASTADIAAAVRTARELDLPIGVRCGGHGILGLAVPEGGLMLDLRPMNAVRVDPERRRAEVDGGAMLGALDQATQPYGLATTAGNVSHTGVGGLTLGGGMGWLARRYGLACDNVESFEMVTAEGEVLRASAEDHPDLYWGLRGGGGNFGVVTRFEFRLNAAGTRALAVEWTYPAEQAAQALRGWRDMNRTAPRQATFTADFGTDRHVSIGFVWVGDPEQGRKLVPQLRSLGRATAEQVYELSYLELQTREDNVEGHAYRRYWKGHFVDELSDAAIDALIDATLRDLPDGMRPGASLQAYGGAIADMPDADTAFSHRSAQFEFVAATRWDDPAQDEARMAAARIYAAGLEPFANGAYVNALSDEGEAGVRRAYSAEKLARLATVKSAYDPDNVFHLNHNIKPQSGAAAQSV